LARLIQRARTTNRQFAVNRQIIKKQTQKNIHHTQIRTMKLSVTVVANLCFFDLFASPIFSQVYSVLVRPGAPTHGFPTRAWLLQVWSDQSSQGCIPTGI
jgi:hypothetical protein